MNFAQPEIQTNKELKEILKHAFALDAIPGCQQAVQALTAALENAFRDIPAENGKKTLAGITYYNNGLITSKNGQVIGSPYESPAGPLEQEAQKEPKPVQFPFSSFSPLLRKQLLAACGTNRKLKNTNIMRLFKLIETAMGISAQLNCHTLEKAFSACTTQLFTEIKNYASGLHTTYDIANGGSEYAVFMHHNLQYLGSDDIKTITEFAQSMAAKPKYHVKNPSQKKEAYREFDYRLKKLMQEQGIIREIPIENGHIGKILGNAIQDRSEFYHACHEVIGSGTYSETFKEMYHWLYYANAWFLVSLPAFWCIYETCRDMPTEDNPTLRQAFYGLGILDEKYTPDFNKIKAFLTLVSTGRMPVEKGDSKCQS